MQCHQRPVVERHDCGCRDPLGQVVFAVSLRWPRSDCHLAKLTAQSHIVDAKSPYDVLSKGSAISRLDRRSDGDRGRLSRESHSLVGASFSEPADGLTKAELVNTSGALEHWIQTSHFALVQEQAAMQQRGEQLPLFLQSRAAAEQTRRETMESPSEATDDI